ncbi:hypothetical protein RJ641_007052 [Dillenia turbinata]|uniref:Uncharacterized protein n=1 Tax=Dillenia turbinata TaxID=194707 RepID=A0AAN8VEG8_9MAGN
MAETQQNQLVQDRFSSTKTLNSLLTPLITHLQNSLSSHQPPLSSPHGRPSQSRRPQPLSSSCPTGPHFHLSLTYVKLVARIPTNFSLNISAVHASYALFNSLTVMVGSGFLAPYLIKAHLAARPSSKKVWVFGGSCEVGDIASCATNSDAVLVKGEDLKIDANLDFVGSFKESLEECNDEAIRRGRVFVVSKTALVESAELVGASKRCVLCREDVCGTLVDLVKGEKGGRKV